MLHHSSGWGTRAANNSEGNGSTGRRDADEGRSAKPGRGGEDGTFELVLAEGAVFEHARLHGEALVVREYVLPCMRAGCRAEP